MVVSGCPQGAVPSPLRLGRKNASASTENVNPRADFISPLASSRAVENEQNEAKREEKIEVEAGTLSLPPTQVHQTWLRSCGDIESSGARTSPTDGAPLSIHSVGRVGLCTGPDRCRRVLYLPPDEAPGTFPNADVCRCFCARGSVSRYRGLVPCCSRKCVAFDSRRLTPRRESVGQRQHSSGGETSTAKWR